MRYRKFQPATALHPFVECYFVWEGEVPEPLEVQSPPSGFSAIVFNYADPYYASQNNGELIPVPKAFASGQFTSNYQLKLKGKIGMAGIVLKPSSLHNFFGLRMSHLVNSRMPLSLLPDVEADPLWGAIKKETSDKNRIKILEEFMLPYVQKAKARLSVIDEAVEYIDLCKGSISVEAVAAHLKISRRYLEKRFLEKVGVSPKFYARIKRFGTLSNKIAHNEKIDWQEIVFEYGFHDQSHLVKEFMEFNQMNPSQYHLQHREMTRFVKR
jgi:AraC-like DNA-binding protein